MILCIACRCRLRIVDCERGYHALTNARAKEIFKKTPPAGRTMLCNGRGFAVSQIEGPPQEPPNADPGPVDPSTPAS